ncbi:hypothetical protein BCY76_016385, partial [Nesterenkonia sp. PF2B19]
MLRRCAHEHPADPRRRRRNGPGLAADHPGRASGRARRRRGPRHGGRPRRPGRGGPSGRARG